MHRRDVLHGAAALTSLSGLLVRAQERWPARTITLIVPFPPGGQVGNAAAAKAPPDGYTLLVTLSSLAVLPEAERLFGRPTTYEVSQLLPVARILADPTV